MFFEERCSLDNWDVFVHLHAVLCGMQKVVLIFLHLKWFKLILIVVNYCQKNSRRFSYLILLSHYSETTSSTTSFWYQRKFSCCFSSKLISQNANLHFLSDEKKPHYQKYIQCDIITTSLLEEWDHQATWLTRPAVFSNTNISLLALWKYQRKAWKNLLCNYRYYLQLQKVATQFL